MDYTHKDFKDKREDDIEYLLKDKFDASQNNPRNKIENISDQALQDYEPINQNDLINFKDKKEIESSPTITEDYTLLTLNNISHCQSCKETFNYKVNAPYLLPCNHFFCKKCIEEFSSGRYSINCPIDGIVANSFSELTLLSNLLDKDDKKISHKGEYCLKHKDQKLTHLIEETKEVICVYCAFNLMKTNPRCQINEVEEKCKQMTESLDQVLEKNQQYAEGLQGALDIIKKNKETVDHQITQLYDKMIEILFHKKEEYLKKTELIFGDNAAELSERLEFFSGNLEIAQAIKDDLNKTKGTASFCKVIDKYNHFMIEANNNSKLSLSYKEMNCVNEDEKKLLKLASNWTQITSKSKTIYFGDDNTASTIQSEQMTTEDDKMKRYQNEMYVETNNDKPSKKYLSPEAIYRAASSVNPYQKKYEKTSRNSQIHNPNQYNNNAKTISNTKQTSICSRGQIDLNHSQTSVNAGNIASTLEYDYRKKRNLNFDNND